MSKILIIEDDPLIQRMYSKELYSNGFEVEIANDGEDGLLKALSVDPHLILLDIMMPKKNGFELLKELKSLSQTKEIPVIILSNLMNENDEEFAIKNGAVKFLVKSNHEPFEVLEIIKSTLVID